MDDKDREINRLNRRIAGLEKTLQIVTGFSGRVEKNLRQLFEVISDTIPVPLVIATQTGKILFSNGKAQEIFRFSEEDSHDVNASDLYENPGDRQTLLNMLAKDGEIREFAVNMKKSDGSVFPASLFSHQILFEGQDCLLSVTYDLSEFRREEERRLVLERQLRQTQKMEAIGVMASGIAHDFNNILSVIFGRLQLAMMILPPESKARKEINEALRAADRAKTMIGQLLAFCRKKEEERKPFHIDAAVTEAAEMIKSLTSSNVDVRLRIESESSIVLGDPTQIHQVLMNLVSNANHALKDREGVIEIRLEEVSVSSDETFMIPRLRPGAYVKLTVSDNGPGMEKEVIERVFDPFFTTKPVGEGTGMGLAVVHGIVQGCGGGVSVESEPGRGAAFYCYFPLIARTENVPESVPVKKTMQEGAERILFVDDEKDILIIYGQMLRNKGYQVTTRASSPEAVALFKENPELFDLIITDDAMPVMSGKAVASEILKIRPNIPIIMITGCGDKTLSEIGTKAVIRKPFTREEIGTAVREALDKSREKENG